MLVVPLAARPGQPAAFTIVALLFDGCVSVGNKRRWLVRVYMIGTFTAAITTTDIATTTTTAKAGKSHEEDAYPASLPNKSLQNLQLRHNQCFLFTWQTAMITLPQLWPSLANPHNFA